MENSQVSVLDSIKEKLNMIAMCKRKGMTDVYFWNGEFEDAHLPEHVQWLVEAVELLRLFHYTGWDEEKTFYYGTTKKPEEIKAALDRLCIAAEGGK